MTEKAFHPRKQRHLKNLDYSSNTYVFFLTICAYDKQPHFSKSEITEIITSELEYRRQKREIRLFCYCLMPDHLHLLISFDDAYAKKIGAFGERALQNWVSIFKRYTSRIVYQKCGISPLWQKNFYDHVVRNDESLIGICEYILNNPVRRGITSSWEEYRYSKTVDPLAMQI